MYTVSLNKETVSCMEDVYRLIAEAFRFPSYFGANLDALYDCLTESREEREIILSDGDYLEELLGKRYLRLRSVLYDAMRDAKNLKVREYA